MKNNLILAVKNYSEVMLDKAIEITDSFEFEKCCASKVDIFHNKFNLEFIVNIEKESLENFCNVIFGMVADELILDLQKEIANTIGGYFADKFYIKDYKLSLPEILEKCDIQNSIYFYNDILKLSIRLRIKNGS